MVLNGRIKAANVVGDLRAIPVTSESQRWSTAEVGISGGLEEIAITSEWGEEVNDGVRRTIALNACQTRRTPP